MKVYQYIALATVALSFAAYSQEITMCLILGSVDFLCYSHASRGHLICFSCPLIVPVQIHSLSKFQ